jgi:hypothetical protein
MPESSLRQRNWLLRLGVALMVLTLPASNHPLARLAHYLSGVLTVFGGGLMAFGENLSPSMGWAGVWVAFFGFLGLFIPSRSGPRSGTRIGRISGGICRVNWTG